MAFTFSQQRGRVALVLLVLVHFAVISRQVDGGAGQSLLTRIVLTIVSPVRTGTVMIVDGVYSLWIGYVDLRGVRRKAETLEERARALEIRLLEREQLATEAERLRALFNLRSSLRVESVAAEVVGRDGVPWARTLTIDKGRFHGLALDAPVVSPAGVVGRVIALGPSVAKVQLLLDRTASAGVVVERSRTPGVLGGPSAISEASVPDLVLRYVPALADVAVGDLVLTSGTDGIYPKGLPAGTVRTVQSASLFKEVRVAPAVRPEGLDLVLVLLTGGSAEPVFDEVHR